MNSSSRRLLFGSPRVLGFLLGGFLGLFTFEVFDGGQSGWATGAAFLIHLLASAVVLVALGIAWRWEWVGCILFMGLGVLYLLPFWGDGPDVLTYVVMTAPLFLTGLLFCLNWHQEQELRSRS